MNTAKLFWSGRSRAVRLRKACNLDGEPARIIRRQGAAGVLEPVAAAKVRVAVARMEQGNLSGQRFRGIGEYRTPWGPGLRLYLAKEGLDLIVLLGGGSKRRQQQDIDQAVAL